MEKYEATYSKFKMVQEAFFIKAMRKLAKIVRTNSFGTLEIHQSSHQYGDLSTKTAGSQYEQRGFGV